MKRFPTKFTLIARDELGLVAQIIGKHVPIVPDLKELTEIEQRLEQLFGIKFTIEGYK